MEDDAEYESMVDRGRELYRGGAFAEAREVLVGAIGLGQRLWGDDSPLLMKALGWLAMATVGNDTLDDAARHAELALHERVLRIAEAAYDPDSLEVAGASNDVALDLRCLGRHAEALPLYRRVLAIAEQRLPADDYRLVATLEDLGDVLTNLDRGEEAIPLLERAARTIDAQNSDTAKLMVHVALGRAMLSAKRFGDARTELEITLRQAESNPNPKQRCSSVAWFRGWLEEARRGSEGTP